MKVSVAYSPGPRTVDLIEVELPAGANVAAAIDASALLMRHRTLALATLKVGLWGRSCTLDAQLTDGDRVEVYRALMIDPKDARRLRGRRQKRQGQGRKPA